MQPSTFAVLTFGCKVNQYESQALRESLLRRGAREVAPSESPSLYVLNTCTVTEVGAREAERTARGIARFHPGARIVFTGCAAMTDRARLAPLGQVVGQDVKSRLADLLNDPPAEDRLVEFPLHRLPNRDIFDLEISRFDGHTRAFLKVEDGCDLNCSFCIIPRVRGTVASRPRDRALDEARRLIGAGHAEIVLTGVHLGSYGKDLAGRSLLPDLVERLLALPGLRRVRLSSIEVNEIETPLLDLLAAEPRRFCPHLHLPLQSGDDAILRAMRRRYNARQFLAACERVASLVPDPAFTTDVIVGFPGETEEQFQGSLDLCRRAGMSRLHVFPYSPRRGTDAAKLRDDVPGRVKKSRLRRLRSLAEELTRSYALKFVAREVDLLVEESDGTGYTERYLRARCRDAAKGAFVSGRGIRLGERSLLEVSA